jgi:hypothetical protein
VTPEEEKGKEESSNDHIKSYRKSVTYNENGKDDGSNLCSNLFFPYMGDSLGQQADLMYLKDRTLTKNGLDYTVGAL